MITSPVTVQQTEHQLPLAPLDACRMLRRRQTTSFFLDGTGGFAESWLPGPLLAIRPSQCWNGPLMRGRSDGLAELDRLVTSRRDEGGTAETGIAVLLSYDALQDHPNEVGPQLIMLRVDRSLRFDRSGGVRLTIRGERRPQEIDEILNDRKPDEPAKRSARIKGRPQTSLPRDRYLRAVERVKHHIARGDIYQANLCQRFRASFRGDVFELYAQLVGRTAAPQSAFVETPGFSLVSISPETFLRMKSPDEVETWPIKGTRPRGSDAQTDLVAQRALQESPKDRAELLMIVDLERNDLSRVCRPGTVRVSDLARLRSYAAVHHLVAGVHGRLRAGVGPADLIRATFPGGSISGAPKIRAMQILRELEPVARQFFTGSLFWFGDDGHLDSSILIRSWTFDGETATLGAGGGIVADSDPEQEWEESNHKARALARAMGFEPEEAL